MFSLDPSFSKAVAAILRFCEKQTSPLNSARMLKQRQRAIYYQRYPFGQKQKAKILAQGWFTNPDGTIARRTHSIAHPKSWRNCLDRVSKPE